MSYFAHTDLEIGPDVWSWRWHECSAEVVHALVMRSALCFAFGNWPSARGLRLELPSWVVEQRGGAS